MRDIKFRTWRTIFTQFGCPTSGEMIYDIERICTMWDSHTISVNRIIKDTSYVMQYTGLKDKNGKEIYEGDILEIGYNGLGNVQVAFENGKFNISVYKISKCMIVGNIYENKELLGEKQ